MSFLIQYRTLFEVNVLHGYYLNGAKRSYWDALEDLADGSDEKREELKSRAKRKLNYDIRNDLTFTPTIATQKVMNAHKMLFRTTSTGFLVALKVKQIIENGITTYKPFIELPETFNLSIKIQTQNSLFQNFTNLPFKSPISAFYHFTNTGTGKIYPSIANPTPKFQDNTVYEMGSMVKVGTQNFEALKNTTNQNTSNTNFWRETPDYQQITTADHLLVSASYIHQYFPAEKTSRPALTAAFSYQFPSTINVSNANFKLENEEGTTPIVSINGNGQILRKVNLKFDELKIGDYNLIVEATGFSASYPIHVQPNFFDQKNNSKFLGVAEIIHQASLLNFRLLEEDGRLRMNADASAMETPSFEIRLNNRSSYWKYIPLPNENNILEEEGISEETIDQQKVYVSDEPQPFLSQAKVNINDNSVLPNASPNSLQAVGDRLLSEVYLSKL